MHEHGVSASAVHEGVDRVILLGNPNVGKSSIFGLLTGKYVTVSNYPGTTVEVSTGNAVFGRRRAVVIDTPGVNSLVPTSEDELVTRDILLAEAPRAVIQVADAKNIRRSLLLTIQLIEMGLPVALDLNMDDEARSRGVFVDAGLLAGRLGIPVVTTVAVQRQGIDALREAVGGARPSSFRAVYDAPIRDGIDRIAAILPDAPISRESIALMVLAGDASLKQWLNARLDAAAVQRLEEVREDVQRRYGFPLAYVIGEQRLRTVDTILSSVTTRLPPAGSQWVRALGEWSMHPFWGVPILIAVLILIYYFVGQLGAGVLVDFFEETVFGQFLNPWATRLITLLVPWKPLQDLFVGEYGIVTMALTYAIAIVLPITTTFFIAFGVLEDSGYLPRLAVMLNKIFKAMGLNGKAVLPMVLGLGCDTMATMTTRILETRKERMIVTLLLALGVPCSAQLGVVTGMAATLPWAGIAVWVGTLVGVIFLVGFLAAKIFKGDDTEFMLEIPPIRRPLVSNILVKTAGRVEWYLREAVPLFILGTLFLFVLDRLTVLAWLTGLTSPLVEGVLGLPARATEAFLVGFLRRDYGAAGLFALQKAGQMNAHQVVVSLVTITLFVPCIANFFMMIKERGLRPALGMAAFIFPFAFLAGGAVHAVLTWLPIVR